MLGGIQGFGFLLSQILGVRVLVGVGVQLVEVLGGFAVDIVPVITSEKFLAVGLENYFLANISRKQHTTVEK